MNDLDEELALRFEENRTHLRSVGYRMLGSLTEADDAIQEAWLRLNRSGGAGIDNLGGWLTTVVARICLDMLRAREARKDQPAGVRLPEAALPPDDRSDPADEAVLAESVGLAMLVVLDTLEPAERLAFVLHDVFAVPFDEIATVVDRTPTATRQLASRARRRVQGSSPGGDVDATRHRRVVDAFLAASRGGDFEGLLAVLDPAVVLRVDPRTSKAREVRGATSVVGQARSYGQLVPYARLALVDGQVGIVVTPHGRLRVAMRFRTRADRIIEIDVLTLPTSLDELDLAVLAA